MKIGIDMDNTITDFTLQFINYALKDGYEIDSRLIDKYYDIETCIIKGTPQEKKQVLDSFMIQDDYWLTMVPIVHSIEIIKKLSKKHEIQIVTAPSKNNKENCKKNKAIWIAKYLPMIN